MKRSLLRLFKAVEINDKPEHPDPDFSNHIWKMTIENGFIFSPEVYSSYNEFDLEILTKEIISEIGITPEQMNNAFHKSWDKVANTPLFQLVVEQMIHYFTTYGYEFIGTYKDDTVYIPAEKLEIPELRNDIKLTVIHGMTKDDIRVALMDLLDTGIALKEYTVKDCIELGKYIELSNDEVDSIKNKEVKIALYDKLGVVPKDPVEFLRYVVYKSTGKTLLIKNRQLISEIKEGDLLVADDLFRKYRDQYGMNKLAQIFNRFKPIFLAFKAIDDLKPFINRLSKLSKVHHKPMRNDYLNDITSIIKNGYTVNSHKLKNELERVNVFRKIRLAYALNYRSNDVDSILYKVRNGKGFSTEFDFKRKKVAKQVLGVVLDSIANTLKINVEGKKIFIPSNIRYALPSTEKQFTGNFPSGTSVSVDNNMIFGIHWEDVDRHRIDLDLSLVDITGYKYGWDSDYRSKDKSILFSGDMTSASKPKGATELFYVKNNIVSSYILMVNYYNYNSDIDVPFKIMVAKNKTSRFQQNYMINPNNVLMTSDSKMDVHQKVLGILSTTEDECRFYFTEVNMGNSITSYGGHDYITNARKYMFNFYKNSIDFNELLLVSGAEFVDEVEDCDIDLSPENIKKDDIINLLV